MRPSTVPVPSTSASTRADAGLGGQLAGLGLGDPPADAGGIATGVQGGAVGGQLPTEVGALLAQGLDLGRRRVVPGR